MILNKKMINFLSFFFACRSFVLMKIITKKNQPQKTLEPLGRIDGLYQEPQRRRRDCVGALLIWKAKANSSSSGG